jgi:putative nucleotidyltransferase with HDIG domain
MSAARQLATRVYIVAMALAACACLAFSLPHWRSTDPVKFICYLAAAIIASALKVSMPGVETTMSMNFLITLLCIVELGLPETLIIGLLKSLAQAYWKPARDPKPIQLAFNLSQVTVLNAASYGAYRFSLVHIFHGAMPFALMVAAVTQFACNTVAMSIIIGLTEDKPVRGVWAATYRWTFPYYMVGAAIAGLISYLNSHIGWQTALLLLAPIYVLYRSYRLYLGKLETEKKHAEQVSNLHLRTIEALALAIGAKDETTGEHLQRVRVYAMEIGKELGLSDDEIEALRAAAVLHDIGKLAVPEHIISKPGKLTPEEFEKMKIHPIVGAEILEQVDFPYPVVPIVRAHHEKWDGSGYPYGLKGDAIPIGARILTAVDCLDALASDRQYRKALPLDEAMAKVASEAGTSFDPRVVEILRRRYVELEKLAHEQPIKAAPKLSVDIKVERGLAPDAGFAEGEVAGSHLESARDALSSTADARKQAQSLLHISQQMGSALGLEDVLSLLAVRLKRMVAHDAMAVFLLNGENLIPEFVSGRNYELFSSLRIPLGEGLCGWVAENRKPILNGNPSVEPGYVEDTKHSSLRSALAMPIPGRSSTLGVLALYCAAADGFTRDQLVILETVTCELAPAIERISSGRQNSPSAFAASAGSGGQIANSSSSVKSR